MLTTLSNTSSLEKGSDLFITFLFIIFFFQFFRNFLLEKIVDSKTIFTQTIIILIWYGLTLMIT
jgi:hypothetical protein